MKSESFTMSAAFPQVRGGLESEPPCRNRTDDLLITSPFPRDWTAPRQVFTRLVTAPPQWSLTVDMPAAWGQHGGMIHSRRTGLRARLKEPACRWASLATVPHVERMLLLAGIGLLLWAISCILMVLFAKRLPDGLMRQVVEFLPSCVATARRLRTDPDVPRRAKIALLIAVIWVVSPIDLLPEFLPVIGPLDDVVAVILLLRFAARSIPRATLMAAWPSDPRLLERILGRDRTVSASD